MLFLSDNYVYLFSLLAYSVVVVTRPRSVHLTTENQTDKDGETLHHVEESFSELVRPLHWE